MLEVHGERQKMSSFAILGWATPTRPATHSVAESRPQSPSRTAHSPTHEAAARHLARAWKQDQGGNHPGSEASTSSRG